MSGFNQGSSFSVIYSLSARLQARRLRSQQHANFSLPLLRHQTS